MPSAGGDSDVRAAEAPERGSRAQQQAETGRGQKRAAAGRGERVSGKAPKSPPEDLAAGDEAPPQKRARAKSAADGRSNDKKRGPPSGKAKKKRAQQMYFESSESESTDDDEGMKKTSDSDLQGRNQVGLARRLSKYQAKLADEVVRREDAERDKAFIQCLVEKLREDLQKSEKARADLQARNVGLEARCEQLEQSTELEVLQSETGLNATDKVKKRVKIAAKVGKEAQLEAKLPPVQKRILEECKLLYKDYGKAVVRQIDPEEFVLHGRRTHVWLPVPRPLSLEAAKRKSCKTAGVGPLGPGKNKEGSLAPEPPMRCNGRRAMNGGLFGVYPGTFKDWLKFLARIACKNPGVLRELRRESKADGSGEVLTEDELYRQCEVVCTTSASKAAKQSVYNSVYNSVSWLKRRIVYDFLHALGYRATPGGAGRKKKDVDETCVVMARVYGFVPESNLNTAEIAAVAQNYMTAKQLRGWRTQSYRALSAAQARTETGPEDDPDADEAAAAKYDAFESTIPADVLFGNGEARATYVQWATMAEAARRDPLEIPDMLRGDASILTLARLDAWMAVQILFGLQSPDDVKGKKKKTAGSDDDDDDDNEESLAKKKKNGKKKGKTPHDGSVDDDDDDDDDAKGTYGNRSHNSVFELLLPRAIEGVLQEIRDEVEKVRAEELRMPFDYASAKRLMGSEKGEGMIDALTTSQTTCGGDLGHRGDRHHQAWRQVTSSHFSPFDDKHYVLALPSFITSSVCSWIGDVKDAFVGVSEGELEYMPIQSPNNNLLQPLAASAEDVEGDCAAD